MKNKCNWKVDLSIKNNQIYNKELRILMTLTEDNYQTSSILAKYFVDNSEYLKDKYGFIALHWSESINARVDAYLNVKTKKIEYFQGSRYEGKRPWGIRTCGGTTKEESLLHYQFYNFYPNSLCNFEVNGREFKFVLENLYNPDNITFFEIADGNESKISNKDIIKLIKSNNSEITILY